MNDTIVISEKEAEDGFNRMYGEHYGPYGTACANTGQFDAGECWKCTIRRLRQYRDNLLAEQKEKNDPACPTCNRAILPGSTIAWKGDKVYHGGCCP